MLPLLRALLDRIALIWLSCCWRKVMTYTELSVVRPLIIVSVSLIWKVAPTFTFIMLTLATQ